MRVCAADTMEKRLLTEAEAMCFVGLRRTKLRQWAKDVGAVRHIGRRVLYDRVVLDRAVDELSNAACNQA